MKNRFNLPDSLIDAVKSVIEGNKKLDPVGKADADIDNDGDVDKSDSYLHNRRKAIKKAMKNEEVEQVDEAPYTHRAATFNGNVVKGTGSTKEAARKDAEKKAKEIGSSIRKQLPTKEEVELDELSKGKLKSYAKKAYPDMQKKWVSWSLMTPNDREDEPTKNLKRGILKRSKYVQTALKKTGKIRGIPEPTKEEVEQTEEVKKTAPFSKPYKKVGDRKDEYGNVVKNAAKYLAKKAMKKQMAKEDIEQTDEGAMSRMDVQTKEKERLGSDKVKGGGLKTFKKKDEVDVKPKMAEAFELPKKVIMKGHEIAKKLIKMKSKVDNPYAVGMATAKKKYGID